MLMNIITFEKGSSSTGSDGNYIFEYDFAVGEKLGYGPWTQKLYEAGQTIGKDRTGKPSRTNTLIVNKDCETVRTSFPGKL